MEAAAQIRELIKEAHDMRRHHDDMYWTESDEARRQFHSVKVHHYRGELLGLERALRTVLGDDYDK